MLYKTQEPDISWRTSENSSIKKTLIKSYSFFQLFFFFLQFNVKIFDVVKFKKTGKWLLINKKQHMACYSTSYDHSKWRLKENDYNFYNL